MDRLIGTTRIIPTERLELVSQATNKKVTLDLPKRQAKRLENWLYAIERKLGLKI